MTIALSDNTPRISYSVSEGVTQTSFAVPFIFFDGSTDLNVFVDNVARTYSPSTSNTTLFTVTGGNGATGTITTTVTGASGGSTVIITRDVPLARTTDFPSAGAFEIAKLNTELDTLLTMITDADDENSRALRLQDSDEAVSLTLPLKADRLGTVLGFNATTGAAEVGPTIADVSSLSAITADISTLADIEDGTDATDAIQTVAGISSNVTTVAGIASNVTTVAGITANIASVVADEADIGTVAANISSVNTVATNIADVITVANDLAEAVSEVETVANDLNEAVSEIDTVAGSISNVDTVGTNIANVNTVAGISSNVTTVAGVSANVTTVAGISSNVTTVAGISSDVTAVAGDATDIGTVATNIANVNTVGGISGNVTTVAGISANVTTVAGISSNVSTVAGDSAAINAVANDATDIGLVAGSIANVNNVGGSIANVNTVASNLASVNNFGEVYRISASAPTTSLDLGDLYFDTTSDTLKVYGASGWQNAGSSINGTSQRYHYDISGTPTSVTGADANGNTLTYDAGYVDVYVNGVRMSTADVTVTSGDTVTFAEALADGDEVDIVGYGTFSVASLNADNLDSGTVPDARFPATLPAISGANLTNLDASDLASGTVPSARVTGAYTGITTAGQLTFADNEKAIFGAGSDLEVYHDGSNSIIKDVGTGRLQLLSNRLDINKSDGSEGMATFIEDAQVILYYDNAVKFQTTSTGIDVTSSGDATLKVTAGGTSNDSKIDFVHGTTTDGGITFDHNGSFGSEQIIFRAGNNTPHVYIKGDGDVNYHTSGSFRAYRFNSSTNPYLNVGSIGCAYFNASSTDANAYALVTNKDSSSTMHHICFKNINSVVGTISTSGSSTSYNTTSDARLKENVTADWDATTRLKQLNPVRFNFIADADTTVDGFLAHEVQSVVPEAITGTHNEVAVWQDGEELPDGVSVGDNKLDEDGNTIPVYQSIDQSKIVPLLVKTIQELEARITALENA